MSSRQAVGIDLTTVQVGAVTLWVASVIQPSPEIPSGDDIASKESMSWHPLNRPRPEITLKQDAPSVLHDLVSLRTKRS